MTLSSLMELMSKTIKSYLQTFDSPALNKNGGMHFNKKIYFCHLAAQRSSQAVEVDMSSRNRLEQEETQNPRGA